MMKCFYIQEFYHVDPNFIKLFRLAQLIIEYLLVSFTIHTQFLPDIRPTCIDFHELFFFKSYILEK